MLGRAFTPPRRYIHGRKQKQPGRPGTEVPCSVGGPNIISAAVYVKGYTSRAEQNGMSGRDTAKARDRIPHCSSRGLAPSRARQTPMGA